MALPKVPNVMWREEPEREEPGGVGRERGFVADTLRFRLVVRRADGRPGWRFLVLRRQDGRPLRLIGSGTAAILGAAMEAACQKAARFDAVVALCEARRGEGAAWREMEMIPPGAMLALRSGAWPMMA
jgi:hypothetical protein